MINKTFRFLLEKRKLGKENHNGAVLTAYETKTRRPATPKLRKRPEIRPCAVYTKQKKVELRTLFHCIHIPAPCLRKGIMLHR